MSKSKFYAGRALVLGAIASFLSFLVLWAKHKSLAKAFLACSATSAIAGGVLIHAYKKDEEAALESLYECSEDLEEAVNAQAEQSEEMQAAEETAAAPDSQTENVPTAEEEMQATSEEVPVDETATETEFAQS